jgi:hypothetical protein
MLAGAVSPIRLHLSRLALALLAAQLTGVFAAPFAITCRARALQAAALDCCALHGPGASCPMDKARAANRDADCRLTSGGCQDETALVSLLGVTGVLIPAPDAAPPDTVHQAIAPADPAAPSRDLRPHSPPPRA